jgi:AcrR family transcriptional regulator
VGRPRVYDERLRLRMLDEAGQVVSSRGIDALSARAVAASSGTTTAAVYALFGGMPGLLSELYAEAFRRFGTHLASVPTSDDPVEDIKALGRAYRTSALADPDYYQVMFGGRLDTAAMSAELGQAATSTFMPLLHAVTRAVRSAAFAPVDPAAAATSLWANVHGLVSLELGGLLPPEAGDPGQVFELALTRNMDGWLA